MSNTEVATDNAIVGQVILFHSLTSWRAYFESSKSSNKLTVIDFTAEWCGPCKLMEPTMDELATKHTDVDFVKIDVDEFWDVARQFEVQAMPTFLFVKEGHEVDRVVGVNKGDLQNKVEMHKLHTNTNVYYN